MSRPSITASEAPDQGASSGPVAPYSVSTRVQRAIQTLRDTDSPMASSWDAPLPRVGVVSDAAPMRVLLSHCFRRDYEVVASNGFADLFVGPAEAHDRRIGLLATDLYTLEHQSEAELAFLREAAVGVPLLVLSQEVPADSTFLRRDLLGWPCAVLPLPADIASIRRMAAALLDTGPPPQGR